jgi:hypothetical protein
VSRITRYRPSPALAVSVLALAVASVGTAGALPGKGKVKANDLAKNAVRGKAIADRAVGNAELADGAVSAEKLGPVSIVSGPTDPLHDSTAGDGNWGGAISLAQCPPGTKITGGGVRAISSPTPGVEPVHVQFSFPEDDRTWHAAGISDNGPGVGSITAYAVCLD